MITRAEVEKLLRVRSPDSSVFSLYLRVPLDPPALRSLPGRAEGLLAAARSGAAEDGDVARARDEDRRIIRRFLEIHAREWLGHTVAIFACGEQRLAEAFVLPGPFEDRAVFATRPHVRPLLAALQRFPGYCAVVVDRQHAWVFRVMGERIDKMTLPAAAGAGSGRFAGWYGLDGHRVHDRVAGPAGYRYGDAATALGPITRAGGSLPIVIGGHPHDVLQFLEELTDEARDQVAGKFTVDPHEITPSRVRELAGQAISHWVAESEQHSVTQLLRDQPAGLAATGLQPCLDAVNQRAAKLLIVPENGMAAGFACQRCAMLSSTGTDCPDWGAASVAVPDLIEEMAVTALRDGAQVEAAADPPGGIAARLRFPVVAWEARSA